MMGVASKSKAIGAVAYVDLFAGPGRYDDGSKSTPIMVLEKAVADPDLSQCLIACFNDKDEDNVGSLKEAISAVPGIEKLKHYPQVICSEMDGDIDSVFPSGSEMPMFSFIDPFGYKGLSLGVIDAVLKDWGCDCVFFFNYGRINAGLNNNMVRKRMDALFGSHRVSSMRIAMKGMSPTQREAFILEQLAEALGEKGARFMLPFRFKRVDGSRTSHLLIFVSKHQLGYTIMKDIMARESSSETDGVSSFEYSPADASNPILFALNARIEDLGEGLLNKFAGRTMSAKAVFNEDHVGKPFIEKNYKKVLGDLEMAGKIVADPSAENRPMRKGERTFGDKTMVTFPPKLTSKASG